MSPAQRVPIVVVAALLAVSCAQDAPKPPAAHPPIVRLTADPAPGGDVPGLVLRIRQLESHTPLRPELLAGPPLIPADALVSRIIDVTIPVGPKFTASTQAGAMTVNIAGTVQHVLAKRYRLKLDYTEVSSNAPASQPALSASPASQPFTGMRAVSSTVELAPGSQCVAVGRLAQSDGQRIICISIE